LSRRIW